MITFTMMSRCTKKLLTDLHCHSRLVCATHCHTQRLRNIHYTQAENTSTLFIFFISLFCILVFFSYFSAFFSIGQGKGTEGEQMI